MPVYGDPAVNLLYLLVPSDLEAPDLCSASEALVRIVGELSIYATF